MAWKKTDYARFAKGPIYGGITGGYESKTMAFPEEEYDTGGYIKSSLAREEAPFMYAPQGRPQPEPTYATNIPSAATEAQGRGEKVMFLSDTPKTEQFLAEREGAGAPPFKQVIPSVNMQKGVTPPAKPTKTGLKAFDLTQEAIENFVNPQMGFDGRTYNPVEEGIKARNEYFKLAYKGLMPSEIDALTSDQIKKVESDADKYLKLEQEKAQIKLGQWKDMVKAVGEDIQKMVEEEETKVPKGEEELIRDSLRQKLGREPNSQEVLDALQQRKTKEAPMLSPAQELAALSTIRKEIKDNPYVKDFRDINNKQKIMKEAYNVSQKTNNYVAVDQALITLFNKMTDPQSVVRESEYARTPENLSMLNRLKGKVEKIMKGGAGLTKDERKALVEMANNFYRVYKVNYDQTIKDYEDLSIRSGLDPQKVIGVFKIEGGEKEIVERRKTKAGKILVKYSDGTIEEQK